MGMCLPCLGGAAEDVVDTPDPETRRRQLAEAAEKRQKERYFLQRLRRARHRAAHTAAPPTEESRTRKHLRGKRGNKKRWRSRP
ncbi:small VCP/p97-interacting protein isoform X3 [Alosa alosa]|nr:small VCP/p97-interacting protein isoform X1 [Alosa sapidissima]XP_041964946.1 small VCP/p97-interacting protein isoform X1 [Alosa sapidissima]XP_048113728.1 small VCP/p97-interacting protein isoform X3 [Alosa alosa]